MRTARLHPAGMTSQPATKSALSSGTLVCCAIALACSSFVGCSMCSPGMNSGCGSRGCHSSQSDFTPIADAPRELRKVSLPEYVVAPPDVLLIEVVNNIRPIHAPIQVGETLLIQANRAVPVLPTDDPVTAGFKQINGYFTIGADGYINLGPEYGKVLVAEQPLEEIQNRVDSHLRQIAPTIQNECKRL